MIRTGMGMGTVVHLVETVAIVTGNPLVDQAEAEVQVPQETVKEGQSIIPVWALSGLFMPHALWNIINQTR